MLHFNNKKSIIISNCNIISLIVKEDDDVIILIPIKFQTLRIHLNQVLRFRIVSSIYRGIIKGIYQESSNM